MKMKAITLHQPWASFMRLGLKTNETRNRKTSHRGDLVICAAKRHARAGELNITTCALLFEHRFALCPHVHESHLRNVESVLEHLPLGQALCVVNVTGCTASENIFTGTPGNEFSKLTFVSDTEFALGDYGPHRYAWHTTNLRRITCPVHVKGSQGFYYLSSDTAQAIKDHFKLKTKTLDDSIAEILFKKSNEKAIRH